MPRGGGLQPPSTGVGVIDSHRWRKLRGMVLLKDAGSIWAKGFGPGSLGYINPRGAPNTSSDQASNG